MVWTIYHNPRCSKSRDSLALLQEKGIAPEVVLYLEHAPKPAELQQLLQQLDLPARALLRENEPEYAELGFDRNEASELQILRAISQHPRLLQRPIISNGRRAVIGRPPENLLSLL